MDFPNVIEILHLLPSFKMKACKVAHCAIGIVYVLVSLQYSKHLMEQTFQIPFLIYARVEKMGMIDRGNEFSLSETIFFESDKHPAGWRQQ